MYSLTASSDVTQHLSKVTGARSQCLIIISRPGEAAFGTSPVSFDSSSKWAEESSLWPLVAKPNEGAVNSTPTSPSHWPPSSLSDPDQGTVDSPTLPLDTRFGKPTAAFTSDSLDRSNNALEKLAQSQLSEKHRGDGQVHPLRSLRTDRLLVIPTRGCVLSERDDSPPCGRNVHALEQPQRESCLF